MVIRKERFAFIPAYSTEMGYDCGAPGVLCKAYSFQSDLKQAFSVAEPELKRRGFTVQRNSDALLADREESNRLATSITISKGKVVGKHFDVDADTLDVEAREDWITITVMEPDPLPDWVRAWIP